MLSDTNLSHSARSVLEVLPGQVPNIALSRALNGTRKNQLIGIIGTLGNRRSRDAVPALIPMLTNSEVQVVTATVAALGKIASDDALAALKGVACAIEPPLLAIDAKAVPLAPRVRYRLNMGVVLDALLECSEAMSQQGRTNAAAQLYAQLAASEVAPWPGRVAAIGALARSDAAQAMAFVLNMLKQQDEALQALGASLARTMPHPALESLSTVLYACPTHAQISVVESMADRGDPAVVPLLLKATRYPDPHVQAAAARSLARFSPSTEIVQRLAELASGDGPQANAAIDTLAALPRDNADAAILASLSSTNDSVLVGLIRAAGQRGLAAALPTIVRASSNDNPRLRRTAIEALGRLGGHREFELLQQHISKPSPATNPMAIVQALTEISQRLNEPEMAARPIVSLLPVTDAQTRLRLYDCLARLGGTTALNTMRQAAASDDPITREHTVNLLANWPDTSALDELIAIAKTEYNPACRLIVLRGITNLIAHPSARTPDQTFEIYSQTLQVTLTSNEKKLLIPGLASLASPEAMNVLRSCLSDPELQDEAAKSIIQGMVDLILQSPSKARGQIAQLRSANIAPQLRAELDVLWNFMATQTNAVNTWLIAGPYTSEGFGPELLLETPFGPEEPTVSVRWNPVSTTDAVPVVVIALPPANQAVYLASCIVSDREQRAKLRLLARTPVRIWLNDVPVNAKFESHLKLELQQIANVALRKGENRLVVKLPVPTKGALLACTVEATNPLRTSPFTKSGVR
ncbi:MAG: HEAT repeat domain-containing protein [Verrucomicrobiota bacterium]|nr:HEAT repeat domain-containing protein [Verrucomicrobiota bacterium]